MDFILACSDEEGKDKHMKKAPNGRDF